MFKLIPLLIIVILLTPFPVWADFNPVNALKGPIVPCGQKQDIPSTLEHENVPCTLCHFFVMAKRIIEFILALIIFLAPAFIAAGGIIILSSAGKPDQVSWGKRMITYSIIGLFIAFGAYLIVGTVLNALIGGEKIPGIPWAWYKFDCPVP